MWSTRGRTLFKREVKRYVRRPRNTFLPPAITNTLYFAVFGVILGGRIDAIAGLPYILFIVPGLIVLGTISNAFENASFSVFHGRWNEYIHAPLTSPMSHTEMVAAYVGASAVRGLLVGIIIGIVGRLFTPIGIAHAGLLVITMIIISMLFAGLGLIGGLWADDFDDLTVMTQFIIRPLVFFGAVFYSLDVLAPIWQTVSLLNPMVYMVDTVRYSMIGYADLTPLVSLGVLTGATIGVLTLDIWLVKRGYGLTE